MDVAPVEVDLAELVRVARQLVDGGARHDDSAVVSSPPLQEEQRPLALDDASGVSIDAGPAQSGLAQHERRRRAHRCPPRRRRGWPRSAPGGRRPRCGAGPASSKPARAAHATDVDRGNSPLVQLLGCQHARHHGVIVVSASTDSPSRGATAVSRHLHSGAGQAALRRARPASNGAANDVPLQTPKPPRKSSGSIDSRSRPNAVAARHRLQPALEGRASCSSRRHQARRRGPTVRRC